MHPSSLTLRPWRSLTVYYSSSSSSCTRYNQRRLYLHQRHGLSSLSRLSNNNNNNNSNCNNNNAFSFPLVHHRHFPCRVGPATTSSSSSSSTCSLFHTSRMLLRPEQRHRHFEEQIRRCAQRITSLLEHQQQQHSPASSPPSLQPPSSLSPSPHHLDPSVMAATATTTIISQVIRQLSPHARHEVEKTLNRMATQRGAAIPSHSHSHDVASTTSSTIQPPPSTAQQPPPAHSSSSASSAQHQQSDANNNNIIPEPPYSELQKLAYQQAIPFIGFGIMDNAILIIAGEAIDTWLGVSFRISTMCAAAIGNIVSDVAGVMLGTVIEDLCTRMGLPTPHLTEAQRTLRSVRYANQCGICVGLVIGCIIGMFPLLWIDSTKTMKLKRQAKLQELVQDVMEEAKTLVQAERTTLFLRVASEQTHLTPTGDGQYLYAKYHTTTSKSQNSDNGNGDNGNGDNGNGDSNNNKKGQAKGGATAVTDAPSTITKKPTSSSSSSSSSRLIPLGRGIVSRSALTGQALNLYHVQAEPDFDPDTFDLHHGIRKVKNMLCVPVLDEQGRAIAVIQAINKQKNINPKRKITTKMAMRTTQPPQQQQKEASKTNTGETTATAATNTSTTGVSSNTASQENMPQGFTSNDVQILKALASHISVALQSLNKDDADVTMRDTIRTLKEHGTILLEQNQNPIRRRPLFPPSSATTSTDGSD